MSLRPLFAILLAIGLALAPLGIRSGAAMAMPAADHHAQMESDDHCGEKPSKGQQQKSDKNGCCVAMCMAVAPAPASELEPQALAASPDRPAMDQFGRGFLAELPTPPPRLA